MSKYIITGGTGAIGKSISKILLKQGDPVDFLSRNTGFSGNVFKYKWDIKNQKADKKWLTETDTVIHLAGAGVADQKWTEDYKKEIYDSRILSTRFLYKLLKENTHSVKTVVAASAIGIYGDRINGIADENYPQSDNYLARVCKDWEAEVNKISSLGIRVVIIRVGIVLATKSGIIPELSKPIKYYAGAALGKGSQLTSWIHIDDLSRIFIKAAEDINMTGEYNAVAPDPVTNTELTKKIARLLHRPILLPKIPEFVLRKMFGEMADMILSDQYVSCKKLIETGFKFNFPDIESALDDVVE